MTDVWNDNEYTDNQIEALAKANREYRQSGEPQKAQILVMQMEEGRPFDEIELPGNVSDTRARRLALRPETSVDAGLIDIPPRHGKGSGQSVWQEFAVLVSTIDEDVIDQFTRDEIIQILVDRDVIDGDKTTDEVGTPIVPEEPIDPSKIVHVDEPELDGVDEVDGVCGVDEVDESVDESVDEASIEEALED